MNGPQNIEQAMERLHVVTTVVLDERILGDAALALERAVAQGKTPVRGDFWRALLNSRPARFAALIALVLMVVAVTVLQWDKDGQDGAVTGRDSRDPAGPNVPPGREAPSKTLARERQQIDAMFAARDVEGLIGMLQSDHLQSQILTAVRLVDLGDERAIPSLSRLAEQWDEAPTLNPFTRAIEQIKSRTQPSEPNAPDTGGQIQGQLAPESKPVPILSGAITDMETNDPITGVRVQMSLVGGGRVYEAQTDSNGVYVYTQVKQNGAYHLRLTAPEHVSPPDWDQSQETIQLRRGRRAVKDYALARGAGILATAVDTAGRPIRRVRIYASYVSDQMGRGPKRPVRTDAEGTVLLGGLRPDEYMVSAAHQDYALAGRRIVLEKPGQVEAVAFVLQEGIDVVGVATCADGLPASGWEIEARPQWWHSVYCAYDYPIAEDGAFILEHVLPGAYRLDIQIPEDGGSRGICSIEVNLPPETDLLDLCIPKPSPHGRVSVSGVVAFVGGEPDRGFWIHATSEAGHSGSTYLDRDEREFTLSDLVPGLYTIDISIQGERHEFANVKAPGEEIVLEIPVAQARRLRAKVVDRQSTEPITRFLWRRPDDRNWIQISDPNGVFEITSRGLDDVRIAVRAEGYGDKVAELDADTDEATVIELTAPLALAGSVVDETGRPVQGAIVSYRYRRSRDEVPDGKYLTTTDSEGSFHIDDFPANDTYHWLVFRHPDYARSMEFISLQEEEATGVQIVLQKGGVVEGRLYDWHGKPLADTPIYFMDESHFAYWKENRAQLGKVITDNDGFYRIEHLSEELCYAFRNDPDNQLGVVLSAVLPQAGHTVQLDLGGTWSASGRLLAGGEPMANTKLLVTYEVGTAQGFMAYALSDALGRFSLRGLPTGRRCLYWAVPGGHDWGRWIELGTFDFEAGSDLELGDLAVTTAKVTVELAAGDSTVSLDSWDVTIQECDDLNYWGRRVGQRRPRNDHLDPFVFSHVAAGHYEAVARKVGYPSVRRVFDIGLGQDEHAIVLTIPSGSGAITGTLQAGDSELSRPALLLRSTDGSLTAELPWESDDMFSAENLPAGQYVVGLASAALARQSILERVTLGPNEYKEIRLEMPSEDAGRVHDAYLVVLVITERGLLLATPDVWLERAGEVVEPHFNTDDGKSFTGPPGTYTLHAQYPGYRSVRRTVEMKSRQDRTIQEILAPLVITMVRQ